MPLYPYYKWKGVFCQTAAKVVGFRQKVIYCAAFLTPPVRNGRKCHSVWKLVELCRNGKGRRPLPWDDGLLMVCYHFFTMGGAKSHDTEDGILEPGAPDFERKLLMLQRKPRARYRINHISWWAQEMPSEEEYAEARKNLAKVDWAVDYVITHCAPTSIALMENRHNEADPLTDFLQEVKERAHYHYWLFGHYHDNRAIDEKHILLWDQIIQVI